MGKIQIQISALWSLYNFTKYNILAMDASIYSLDYLLRTNSNLIFLVDFSDIHPIMFPKRTKNIFDENSLEVHNGLKILWDDILKELNSKSEINFKLAITPGTELEIYESLRHWELRVEKILDNYIPFDKLQNSSTKEVCDYLSGTLDEKTNSNLINVLNRLVNDENLEARVSKPASAILDLFSKDILSQINDKIFPDPLIKQLLSCPVNDDIQKTMESHFNKYPRKSYGKKGYDQYEDRHHKFHDSIDICNIRLAYNILSICENDDLNIYSPFVTQTDRVMTAAMKIGKIGGKAVAHKSLVPLYIATGVVVYGGKHVENIFRKNYYTLMELKTILDEIDEINQIKSMDYKERKKHLKENDSEIIVSDRIESSFSSFVEDLYGHIEGDFSSLNKINDEKALEKCRKIESLYELIVRVKNARNVARTTAKDVKDILDTDATTGLSALFTPNNEFTDILHDWIGDK